MRKATSLSASELALSFDGPFTAREQVRMRRRPFRGKCGHTLLMSVMGGKKPLMVNGLEPPRPKKVVNGRLGMPNTTGPVGSDTPMAGRGRLPAREASPKTQRC